MTVHVKILGAAAGGGLPQWNCGCINCNLARQGRISPQTQSSIAVSADGQSWAVLNASPDIRFQLQNTQALHPTGLRDLPLKSVLVTNGDIDHVAGLLTLREQQPFTLFASHEIHDVLGDNPIFSAVNPTCVPRRAITLDTPFELVAGLNATVFAVPGKVPLYLEGETVQTDLEGEQRVGVHLQVGGKDVFYIPGCSTLHKNLRARVTGADMLLFDGTLWQDDEMIAQGLSQKTGQRMGHMSMAGPDGSMAAAADLGIAQKIYIHMNNSNPVWQPTSAERAEAEASGWTIGADGMDLKA